MDTDTDKGQCTLGNGGGGMWAKAAARVWSSVRHGAGAGKAPQQLPKQSTATTTGVPHWHHPTSALPDSHRQHSNWRCPGHQQYPHTTSKGTPSKQVPQLGPGGHAAANHHHANRVRAWWVVVCVTPPTNQPTTTTPARTAAPPPMPSTDPPAMAMSASSSSTLPALSPPTDSSSVSMLPVCVCVHRPARPSGAVTANQPTSCSQPASPTQPAPAAAPLSVLVPPHAHRPHRRLVCVGACVGGRAVCEGHKHTEQRWGSDVMGCERQGDDTKRARLCFLGPSNVVIDGCEPLSPPHPLARACCGSV